MMTKNDASDTKETKEDLEDSNFQSRVFEEKCTSTAKTAPSCANNRNIVQHYNNTIRRTALQFKLVFLTAIEFESGCVRVM